MKDVPENCEDARLLLYEAIRERISQAFFPRTRIDEEELLHVIFMKLLNQFLPALDSEEMSELLDREIRHAIRNFKLARRPAMDIEEVNPDEGPSYEEPAWSVEADFERTFERFCNTRQEPEQTVFRRCRTHTRKQIARITGLSHQEISRILKKIPDKFRYFLKNDRD